MMNLITRLAPALALLLFCTSPAIAQTPQDPQITIQHPGFQVLKKDLKSLLDLGTPADQKQWSNIEDFIDTFVAGIDGSRPFQVQLLAGMTPSGYLAALPLDGGFQTFRDNVEGLGYELKRDGKDTSLYQFNMTLDSDQESTPGAAAAEDVGWMKVLADVDYLILSMSSTRSSMPQLKELTLAKKVADSGTGTGAVMQLINPDVTEAAQKHRRSSFTASRKTTMDAMQKRPDETATRFEMRKLSSNLMLDEVERATAESETLQISLQMDHSAPTTPKVSVQGDLAAIAGTALATALQQFNTRPDAFAGIARLPGSALSLRINHPIDDMRKAGMTSFLNLVRDEVSAKLKNGSQRPASEKEAIDGVVTDIVTHLRSGIDSGWMNIFVEAVPDGQGGFNSIGAYNAANAATLTEILPRMKDMHPGTQVELNARTKLEFRNTGAERRVRLGAHRLLHVVVTPEAPLGLEVVALEFGVLRPGRTPDGERDRHEQRGRRHGQPDVHGCGDAGHGQRHDGCADEHGRDGGVRQHGERGDGGPAGADGVEQRDVCQHGGGDAAAGVRDGVER